MGLKLIHQTTRSMLEGLAKVEGRDQKRLFVVMEAGGCQGMVSSCTAVTMVSLTTISRDANI